MQQYSKEHKTNSEAILIYKSMLQAKYKELIENDRSL